MKSYVDAVWFVFFGVFLFCVGVTYQWYVSRNPVYPLTLPASTLDSAKDSLAETLRLLGLRKPSYYYRSDWTDDDQYLDASSIAPGLTLISDLGDDATLQTKVVEPDGTVVHRWTTDWFEIWPDAEHVPDLFLPQRKPGTHVHGNVLMDNGDLIFNFEYLGLIRLTMCGDVVWRLPHQTHHSIDVDRATGNLWVSGRRFHDQPAEALPNHTPPFAEPLVLEVTPDGEILQQISIIDLLVKNDLQGLLFMTNFGDIHRGRATTTGDTLHLNDVEVFPPDLESGYFEPGDLMVSLRNIHAILVFKPDTMKITYLKVGDFVGQHDPDFVDGNTISVFDNNVVRGEDADRQSRIVLLSASKDSSEIYFQGSQGQPFYTGVMGKQQWLPNGNLLLTEPTGGRAFELDPDGEIVWQYVNTAEDEGWVGLMAEAQRLPAKFDRAFFEVRRASCRGSA